MIRRCVAYLIATQFAFTLTLNADAIYTGVPPKVFRGWQSASPVSGTRMLASTNRDRSGQSSNCLTATGCDNILDLPKSKKLVGELAFFLNPSRFLNTANQMQTTLLDCEVLFTDVEEATKALQELGCQVVSVSKRFKSIHAYISPAALSQLVSKDSIAKIRKVIPPRHNKNDTSEGDIAHCAASARQTYGFTGKGVKIGVISDSVRYLSEIQASKDLPVNVTVLEGMDGARYVGSLRADEGEGTAMLEIVHDLCPDAQLFFATAGLGTEAELAEAILALGDAGCDIIVDDICLIPEPAFQDGIVSLAVNEVSSKGCIYVTCAANKGNLASEASAVWEGDFKSAGTYTLGGVEYEMHGFGSDGKDQFTYLNYWNVASASAYGSLITLQWSDAQGNSANDYDLALYDPNTGFVQLAGAYQDGVGCDPFEIMEIGNFGGSFWDAASHSKLALVILKKSGAQNRYLRLSCYTGSDSSIGNVFQHATTGQIYGHNAAEVAISVAAAKGVVGRAFASSDVADWYSSDGPRLMFYNQSGSAYTTSLLSGGGKTLRKPDVMGASSVSCATPGFTPFPGTSSAAPHIAAIVGLMLEACPNLTIDDAKDVLFRSSFSSSGWTAASGYGAVNAQEAVRLASEMGTPNLEFDSNAKTLGAEGASGSFRVKSNVEWSIEKPVDSEWLTLSENAGTGSKVVSFNCVRNSSSKARSAVLTARSGDSLSDTCTIVQEGMTSPDRPVVSAGDGVSYDFITVSWGECVRALSYKIQRAESATGERITLSEEATSPFIDMDVVPGKPYYYWVSAVNEVGATESAHDTGYRAVRLVVDTSGNDYTKDGGVSAFSVDANGAWTVECTCDWISLDVSSGYGAGTVTFSLDKNYDGDSRDAAIVVSSGAVELTISITQPGRTLVIANSGTISINTGATRPTFQVSATGKTYYGEVVDGKAVYSFDYLEIGAGVSVSVAGSRPLVVESETDMKVACSIDVSGNSSGRCGGGVGGSGGSGGSSSYGGSGGSGGSCGSGGEGYTVSYYTGTSYGSSGTSGSAGGLGSSGSSGNSGTSGYSGGKGFGSTGNAASGGSGGSGGSYGSRASSGGSGGYGGSVGSDGWAGGSGSKGGAGGAGVDGSSGSNGVNAFSAALTSDLLIAGSAGGGGGGGGSGGSGGGGSGGGGGGGGGGTSSTEANSYSGNTTSINRKQYQGAIGGFGGSGGSGGSGARSGAGGAGGMGGHGGGAIVLKANGVLQFSGTIDVSAANANRGGTSGSSASTASSGSSGNYGSAGQGALNTSTFSSLYPSSGHKGGNGGTGGAGGNGGKGGAGGAGGYGSPGMVKLYASLLIAANGNVLGANGDNSTSASRCGGLSLATNMKSAALTSQKPTVAATVACGVMGGADSSKIASIYDGDVMVPVVGQLKASHADVSGICESGNYALSLVSGQSEEGVVNGLSLKRLSTLFDGYDQVFLVNETGSSVEECSIVVEGVVCAIPKLSAGEAWTTCVPTGASIAGNDESDDGYLDLAFATPFEWEHGYPVFASLADAWTPACVLEKGADFDIVQSFGNFGEGTLTGTFENLVAIVGENDDVQDYAFTEFSGPFKSFEGSTRSLSSTSWRELPAGVYLAYVMLDCKNVIEESDETNNEFSYAFAIRDAETIGTALDNDTLNFALGEEGDWYGTKGYGSDGIDCVATIHKGNSATNDLSTTVVGPGVVSFKWKVSSEENFDVLQFLVDGTVARVISGVPGSWSDCQVAVEAGEHVLTWRYVKDDSYYFGVDCAWIDQVAWVPDATEEGVATPVVTPPDGSVFTDDSCTVTLSCATEDATIYYTTNGSTPRQADKNKYMGPFTIDSTTIIKAVAVKDGVKSEYVTATITKRSLSLGEAASADALGSSLSWITGGDADWTPIVDMTATTGLSVQSGAIGDEAETWIQTVVYGCGTLAFKWKVYCEWDDSGDATWDRMVVTTNGVEAARMDGTTEWEEVSFSFDDEGMHAIRWTFLKDDYNDEEFADRAWVSGFTWTPSSAVPGSIPDVAAGADAATVNAAVDGVGFADEAVKEAIGGSAVEYAAFKDWAGTVKGAGSASGAAAGEAAVVANEHAAAAYLLGAERLFENAPKIEFEEVAVGDGEIVDAGASTSGHQVGSVVTVTVIVKDGEEAVKCAAEKVKSLFKATSDLGDWNGAAKLEPEVSIEATGDPTTMRFKVTPGDGTSPRAFLQIRR